MSDEIVHTCAVYLRVSTHGQAKEGFGLAAQKKRCMAMAMVKGWDVYQVYSDEGISGSIMPTDRPAMGELLSDLQHKKFQAIIFYCFDRLARSTKILINCIEFFEYVGIKMVSCKENIDTSTKNGRLAVTIFSGIAEHERATIVERLQEGKKIRKQKDGEIGGSLPYGYCRVDKKVAIKDIEAQVVRWVFYQRLVKDQTYKSIAKGLDDRKIKPQRGNKWNPSSICKIIKKKEIYSGCPRNNSDICWPAILDNYYKDQTCCYPYGQRPTTETKNKEAFEKEGINVAMFKNYFCVDDGDLPTKK